MSAGGECVVIVRHDPGLVSDVTGEPAEARVTYEHHDGEPVMVVTFGPVMPTVGDGWVPVIYQMRSCVAPRFDLDDEDEPMNAPARISKPGERAGDRIRRRLAEKGRRHAELADHLGMTLAVFRGRLAGRPAFTRDQLSAAADFLGLSSVAELLPAGEDA